jgi:GntR family transcriptional regulator/MocR family aminotransferase
MQAEIASGRFPGGEKMPSTRELALQLGISRNTVNEAYEMLLAEGYLVSRQGAPTRVAPNVALLTKGSLAAAAKNNAPKKIYTYDFITGRPDLSLFPRGKWLRHLSQASAALPQTGYGYCGQHGLPALRQEIAHLLYRSRGLLVDPADVFITAGATHALHIATKLGVFARGIAIEDPCHSGMLQVMRSNQVHVMPLPVDERGLQVDLLAGSRAGGIYITPSHQFPLGGILQADRRARLIDHARSMDAYIIEDDYDSEFRFTGEPLSPVHALDPQRVIYIGTFSKSVFPAIRIGYTMVPPALQEEWRQIRCHTDVQNTPFEQAALAAFLQSRDYDRHVGKMRRIYGNRRQALLKALQGWTTPWRTIGDASGIHLVVEVPGMVFTDDFVYEAAEQSMRIVPVRNHAIVNQSHQDKLLLGYGHLDEEVLAQGIQLLDKVIAKYGGIRDVKGQSERDGAN